MPDELELEPGEEAPVEETGEGKESSEKEKAEPKVDFKKLERENELLRNELDLQNRKFEHEIKLLKERPAAKPKEDDDEGLDIDLVEAVTNNDQKGFAKAIDKRIKRMGLVGADQVEQMVERRASEYAEQAKVLNDFPELSDPKSEMYKLTGDELAKINADPEYKSLSDGKRISLAARHAKLALLESGKGVESESSRVARIRAQQGPTGGRKTVDPSSEELTPSQKYVAKKMGISEDAYKKRASKGIAWGGATARARQALAEGDVI